MELLRKRFMQYDPGLYLDTSLPRPESNAPLGQSGPSGTPPILHKGTSGVINPRDWTFRGILEKGTHFRAVPRVSALSKDAMMEAIRKHETEGEPLIIENWHLHPGWSHEKFNIEWLLANKGNETWRVRNVQDCADIDMKLSEFVEQSRARARSQLDGEVLYGKDAECPEEWAKWIGHSGVLPAALCPHGPNDLLKHLTTAEGVESLMCYLGVQDTFTPCHKDLCASSGHNLMSYTEDGGSSFWFMTASNIAPEASAYFQQHIGLELDWEEHTVTVEEFAKAPFPVYIAEQRLGDLVLVPPRSCHQVVNRGGITLKTSWSRMTIKGLGAALHHELPIYRRVCRPELYRVKYIVYRSLLQVTRDLATVLNNGVPRQQIITKDLRSAEAQALSSDLRQLLDLFDFILCEEYTSEHAELPTVQPIEGIRTHGDASQEMLPRALTELTKTLLSVSPSRRRDSTAKTVSCNFSCDFCGADVFQSFFECQSCIPDRDDGDGDPDSNDYNSDVPMSRMRKTKSLMLGDGFILCPGCYAEGRTCRCGEMVATQCRSFSNLLKERNRAATFLNQATMTASDGTKRVSIAEELTESALANTEKVKMFHAGCALLKLRRRAGAKVNESRRCSKCTAVSNGGSHSIRFLHGLYCSPCRATSCFLKILKIGVHSADALLAYDAGHNEWHERHKCAQDDFNWGKGLVRQAERTGAVTIYRNLLVIVARKYTTCRPLYPDCVSPGWYDERCDTGPEGPTHDQEAVGCTSGPLPRLDIDARLPQEVSKPPSPVGHSDGLALVSTAPTDGAQTLIYNPVESVDANASIPLPSAPSPRSSSGTPRIVREASETSHAPPRSSGSERQQVYVLMPLRPRAKRCRSALPRHEDNVLRKRRKVSQDRMSLDRDLKEHSSDEERRLNQNYATSLAEVFSTAHSSGTKKKKLTRSDSSATVSDSEIAAGSLFCADSDDEPLVLGKARTANSPWGSGKPASLKTQYPDTLPPSPEPAALASTDIGLFQPDESGRALSSFITHSEQLPSASLPEQKMSPKLSRVTPAGSMVPESDTPIADVTSLESTLSTTLAPASDLTPEQPSLQSEPPIPPLPVALSATQVEEAADLPGDLPSTRSQIETREEPSAKEDGSSEPTLFTLNELIVAYKTIVDDFKRLSDQVESLSTIVKRQDKIIARLSKENETINVELAKLAAGQHRIETDSKQNKFDHRTEMNGIRDLCMQNHQKENAESKRVVNINLQSDMARAPALDETFARHCKGPSQSLSVDAMSQRAGGSQSYPRHNQYAYRGNNNRPPVRRSPVDCRQNSWGDGRWGARSEGVFSENAPHGPSYNHTTPARYGPPTGPNPTSREHFGPRPPQHMHRSESWNGYGPGVRPPPPHAPAFSHRPAQEGAGPPGGAAPGPSRAYAKQPADGDVASSPPRQSTISQTQGALKLEYPSAETEDTRDRDHKFT